MFEFFSKYQCGFRKGYSTQHCLLAILEKWKSAVAKGKSFGALLTDLSKAFDCLLSNEKLLRIKVDGKLNFNEHLKDIISKASLSRVMPYMNLSKKKKLVSSFFNSQFNYCRLIWMFHSHINK